MRSTLCQVKDGSAANAHTAIATRTTIRVLRTVARTLRRRLRLRGIKFAHKQSPGGAGAVDLVGK